MDLKSEGYVIIPISFQISDSRFPFVSIIKKITKSSPINVNIANRINGESTPKLFLKIGKTYPIDPRNNIIHMIVIPIPTGGRISEIYINVIGP